VQYLRISRYVDAPASRLTTALHERRGDVDPNLSRDGRGRVATVLGATAGVAALGLGAARMGYRDAPPGLAVVSIVDDPNLYGVTGVRP